MNSTAATTHRPTILVEDGVVHISDFLAHNLDFDGDCLGVLTDVFCACGHDLDDMTLDGVEMDEDSRTDTGDCPACGRMVVLHVW